jgi:proteasome accessory factor B
VSVSRSKSERILNLTVYLLSARRYVSREQIRRGVEGYADMTDEAFERSFERDKDDLRKIGVPIQTGSNSAYFDDEVGYRIAPTEFELPPISFTDEEAQVLAVAGHVWEQATMAESTVSALAKLRAAGVDVDTDRLVAFAPTLTAREPAFPALWKASGSRLRVRFGYKRPDHVRTFEPWRIYSRSGSWYVVGLDVDRGQSRNFKLSRIVTDVTVTDTTYTVPADADLNTLQRHFGRSLPAGEAVLAIRTARAPGLRRQGVPAPGVHAPDGYEAHRVPFTDIEQFAAIVRSAGPDVLVLEPEEVRVAVLTELRRIAGAA